MEAGNTVTLQSLEGSVQTMTLDDYATRRRSRVSDEGDENTPPPSSKVSFAVVMMRNHVKRRRVVLY